MRPTSRHLWLITTRSCLNGRLRDSLLGCCAASCTRPLLCFTRYSSRAVASFAWHSPRRCFRSEVYVYSSIAWIPVMRMRVPGFFLFWPAMRTLSVSPSPMNVTLPFHSLHLGECFLPRMHGPVCASALLAASVSRQKSAASVAVVSLADGNGGGERSHGNTARPCLQRGQSLL